MPVFEFFCKKCGHKFEDLIFKESDLKDMECPKCGSKDIQKLFSVFGFCSKSADGKISSVASSCTGCQRTICAGCK